MTHVDAIARVDEERERQLLVVGSPIGRRHGVDFGKGEAVFAKAVLQQLLGRGDDLARENVARLHQQITPQHGSATTKVPASFTSLTLKTSPSFTFTVMKMSSFSGAMATCVDSTSKFA